MPGARRRRGGIGLAREQVYVTEGAVFDTLAEICPAKVLYNGNAGAASAYLRSLGLTLADGHWRLGLPDELASRLDGLLQRFGGARADWPAGGDLLDRIDGVIVEPPLGPCLVEYDEAQHFSPYRHASLSAIKGLVQTRFDMDRYCSYCLDPGAFRAFWSAVRLPERLLPPGGPITSPGQLAALLFRHHNKLPRSGYTQPVAGFPFTGGRIAQRAYHDVLWDCVHLARPWRVLGFRPVLRIAVWDLHPGMPESVGGASHQPDRCSLKERLAPLLVVAGSEKDKP